MKKVDSSMDRHASTTALARDDRKMPSLRDTALAVAWQSTIKPFRRDLGVVCLSAKRKQGTPLGASRCFFRKRFIPTPLPLTQKEKGDRFFFLQSRGEPRASASSTRAEAGHYCPPYSRARAFALRARIGASLRSRSKKIRSKL